MGGLQMPQPQTPNLQMPMPPTPLPPEQPQGRKFGLAEIMGSLGDALLVGGGGQAMYAPMLAQQRDREDAERMLREKLAAETEQRARDRQAKIEDAMKLRQFDAANPGPTSLEQNIGLIERRWGPEAAREFAMKPTFVNNWDGTRTQVGGAGGGIPPEAIADLRADPASAEEFDAVFGPGASRQYLGGGASNGTGGFQSGQ
jgi:hypothetical protein